MLKMTVNLDMMRSLLSRGAWIEMSLLHKTNLLFCGRSSHEERGLKYYGQRLLKLIIHVAPLTRSVD